jgi:hypothetical protein
MYTWIRKQIGAGETQPCARPWLKTQKIDEKEGLIKVLK